MNKIGIIGVALSIIGMFSVLFFSISTITPGGIWSGPITGVHVTHNSQPINELLVIVTCSSCTSPIIKGTTDTNGIYTFKPAFVDGTSFTYIYQVTFGGQTYGITGTKGQIVDDPI